MTISFDSDKAFKWLQTILLIAVVGLLLWSKPWDQGSSASQKRTIKVSGQATLEAEPDEYVFSPYYTAKGNDKDALKAELNEKANAAVAKLKELGVEDKNIKVDSSSYDYWFVSEGEEGNLNISLQVTVDNKELAQKVQDFFTTQSLEGQLTPQAIFSDQKRKELDAQAVDEATQDAKKKAEAQAKLLDAKLGKVITVDQSGDMGLPIAYGMAASAPEVRMEDAKISSLPVMPGQNEYTKTISIEYELK